MRNIFKTAVIGLTFGLIFGFSIVGYAQPPDPPSGHGYGGDSPPGGGAAPVGSGIVMLLTLGAAYGSRKLHTAWNRREE
jgi:hypothetical protein